jgi:hypothetical protein
MEIQGESGAAINAAPLADEARLLCGEDYGAQRQSGQKDDVEPPQKPDCGASDNA